MPTITLVAGDYDIDSQGHHVCDENGFAIVLSEGKQVEVIEQTDADRITPILESYRIARGLNADGSQPEPLVEGGEG